MSTFSLYYFLSAFLLDNSFDELDFRVGQPEIGIEPLIVPGLRIVAHVGSQLCRIVQHLTELRKFCEITVKCILSFYITIKVKKLNMCSYSSITCIYIGFRTICICLCCI